MWTVRLLFTFFLKLHQIDRLISNAPEDCHYFLYCMLYTFIRESVVETRLTVSGHGLEEESHDRAWRRVDGRDGG